MQDQLIEAILKESILGIILKKPANCNETKYLWSLL